tara:strand:- start:31374 stop:32033 length:660 start_codon:yes stop_codon:yes gene_type:complete
MINQYIRTLKCLFQSPEEVIDSFIETESSIYTHPFKFLLLGAIPFIILSSIFVDFSSTSVSTDPTTADLLSFWVEVSTIRLSTQFLTLTLFLSIPLLSLPALFFLRDELEGFYSHLILNSYSIGASMPALLTLIPFWVFINIPISDPLLHSTLPAIVIGSIVIITYKKYFKVENIIGWIRILSSFICGYLIYILLKGLLGGVIGYMIFAVTRLAELGSM